MDITKYIIFCSLLLMHSAYGINVGLIAGNRKRHSNPLVIKKYLRHSPVFINIHPGIPRVPLPPPLPLKLAKPPLPQLRSPVPSIPKLPLIAPVMPIIVRPAIPKLPLLPLPLIPPVVSPLPILSTPVLPRVPRLTKLTSPLKRLSSLSKKIGLQKALGSELRPVVVAVPEKPCKGKNILEKLLELKNRGSLTTAEFIRFKKLLLK